MKIHKVEQNTLDWLKLHLGIPTAGGLDQLLTTDFKPRNGEMPKTYLQKKLAESWRGRPIVSLGSDGSWSTEQGMILEEEARPWLELELGKRVDRIGFVTTDDGKFGCSPDGLVFGSIGKPTTSTGVEIKCPAPHTHVKYLLGGVVPSEYVAQVHGGMFATGYERWLFVSYRRGFPPLLVMTERNEAIQEAIKAAVEKFHEDFNAGMAKIREMSTQREVAA